MWLEFNITIYGNIGLFTFFQLHFNVRVTVTLLPDAELSKKMETEEKAKIEEFRKSLTSAQVWPKGWTRMLLYSLNIHTGIYNIYYDNVFHVTVFPRV